MSDAVAAPAACATATVMAVVERAGELAGRRVAVVGAGMLGLCAVAAAATGGASSVTAVDPSTERRRMAEQFGATRVASSAGEAVYKKNGFEVKKAVELDLAPFGVEEVELRRFMVREASPQDACMAK